MKRLQQARDRRLEFQTRIGHRKADAVLLRSGNRAVHDFRSGYSDITATVPRAPVVKRPGQHQRRLYTSVPMVRNTFPGRNGQEPCRGTRASRVQRNLPYTSADRSPFKFIHTAEMVEAVGEKYWPVYFSTLYDRLKPGKIAVIQAITIADRLFPQYRTKADFIQKHIFPGGRLPSLSVLREQAQAADLEVMTTKVFADSYSRTLREWRRRFNAQWNQIRMLGFDHCFYRMWNFYLAASAAGFAAGTTDVVQVACQRPT